MPANESAPARLAHRYAAFTVVVIVLSCALSAGASAVARSAPVQARWVIADLGTLAGTEGTSIASGVNDRGQVVGASSTKDGSYHAFLWQSGRMRDLGTLSGDPVSRAAAINDRGQVVGSSEGRGSSRAFLWQSGKMIDLGTLGGKAISAATAINNRGQIVGWRVPDGEMRHRPVVWDNRVLRHLRPHARLGQATGINERGQIVGILGGFVGCARLTIWSRPYKLVDRATLLRNPCAARIPVSDYRAAINERGQIAATGTQHAYLWENGMRFDLGTLPGDSNSFAEAINDRGQIVGASGKHSTSYSGHAVLWTQAR